MTRTRDENLIALANEIGTDAVRLQSIAKQLDRLHTIECERELSIRESRRYYGLVQAALDIATKHKRSIYIQGDPRGWPVYLGRDGQQITHTDYNEGIGVCPE